MFKLVQGMEGKDGKGDKIVVGHAYNQWGEDGGYRIYVQRVNYVNGKDIKTWRVKTSGLTKEQAIAEFNRINKQK